MLIFLNCWKNFWTKYANEELFYTIKNLHSAHQPFILAQLKFNGHVYFQILRDKMFQCSLSVENQDKSLQLNVKCEIRGEKLDFLQF